MRQPFAAVSYIKETAETRVRAPVNPCGICGAQNDIRTGFSSNYSDFFYFPHQSKTRSYSLMCHLGKDIGPFSDQFKTGII